MPSIRVHTAQNVTLEYEIASLGDRLVAVIIDSYKQLADSVPALEIELERLLALAEGDE